MIRQLTFDLARDPDYADDAFLACAANATAVAAVAAWPNWPSQALLLVGPAGCGKSHLAAIWARRSGATILRAGEPVEPALWDGGGRRIVLEDCDRAGIAEPALFHALNLMHETGGWLLMTARTPAGTWPVTTPDLRSRLRLATMVTINAPDDELARAVLVKLFADRQIAIDQEVVAYAARHCDQSLGMIGRFVALVDDASLAAGRRITRSLAAQILAAMRDEESDQGPT